MRRFTSDEIARLRESDAFWDAAERFMDFQREMCLMATPAGTEWDKARRHFINAKTAYLRAFARDVVGRSA